MHLSMSGCFLKTVKRRESLVFCREAKVSKPDASDWSRRSVRRVFSRDNPTLMISTALFGLDHPMGDYFLEIQ